MVQARSRGCLAWQDVGIMRLCVLCFMALLTVPVVALADSTDSDLSETARLLAILLDSGRVAIGRNQDLINNPSTAETAFTLELFAAQTTAIFKERTGHNLADLPNATAPTMAKPLLERLLAESKRTVESYKPVLNMKGLKYKGVIPATFGAETAMRFQRSSGIYLKQTAPDHLLRNARSKPDSFEAEQMKAMSEPSFKRNGEAVVSKMEDGNTVRILLPLFYEKACLSCHGEPKGERDISGYPREGGREGELGGAISVKIDRNSLAVP